MCDMNCAAFADVKRKKKCIISVNSENLKNLVIFATIFRGEPRDRLTRTLVEYFITQKRT